MQQPASAGGGTFAAATSAPSRHRPQQRRRLRTLTALLAAAAPGLLCRPANAGPPTIQVPTEESLQPGQQPAAAGPFGFLNTIDRSNYLLGDWWGIRPALSQYGISIAIQETSEVFGNVTGGVKQGAAYDGLTQMALQLDTQRAFGWYGGTFNASALQIHGSDLSAENLDTLQTASGIEADRATRLWELWYQQKFLEEDRLDIKIGQQSLDQEFMVSQNAGYLINTMFGWPMLPSADLPGGGPAYPLSALGVRVRTRPIDPVTILMGVFNGNPAPSTNGDPQALDPSGLSFPLNGGVLAIAEIQYTYPSLGTMLYAGQSEPLARTYKLGVWWDSESFPDQQFDNTGLSLANPASNGIPLGHRGDYGIYAVADQLVWVDPREGDRTISLFGRIMGAPQADRNLVTFSMNAGLTFHEPILHRDDDTFAIGMGYAKVSGATAAYDKALAYYTGAYVPVRGGETFVEVTYQYQVTPWWQIQPDMQYVFNPGGGLANPNNPTQRIANELVLGLRTNILF
ncbi:MAG TPA: carbohydrate porin [Acetobacteraceae bacterium]|nr:carbohydrate porin [Acetobacteraceae bacterium]